MLEVPMLEVPEANATDPFERTSQLSNNFYLYMFITGSPRTKGDMSGTLFLERPTNPPYNGVTKKPCAGV